MRLVTSLCLTLLLTFTVVPALARGKGSSDQGGNSTASSSGPRPVTRARDALIRSEGGVDEDAKGRVEVRSRRGRELLEIKAERLTPGLVVSFFIADAEGTPTLVGTDTASSKGQVKVRWRSPREELPLGATLVSELADRAVTLRTAADEPLLEGAIPNLESLTSSGGGTKVRDRSGLENLDLAFAPRAEGKVEVETRPSEGRNKLKVEVEHLPPGTELDVFLENPGTSTLEQIGELTVGSDGEAELEISSQDGDALPFGVESVSELYGKTIEIRTGDGTPRLRGTVPIAGGSD